MKQIFPGPGAYEPTHEQIFHQSPIISVKKDKRLKDIPINTPGPGNYNINRGLGGNKFRLNSMIFFG